MTAATDTVRWRFAGPPALPPALRMPLAIVAVFGAVVVAVLATGYSGDTAAGGVDRLLTVLVPTGAAAVTMAWSQVVLGVHYATDTIGGFGTATAVFPATALLVDRLAGGTS